MLELAIRVVQCLEDGGADRKALHLTARVWRDAVRLSTVRLAPKSVDTGLMKEVRHGGFVLALRPGPSSRLLWLLLIPPGPPGPSPWPSWPSWLHLALPSGPPGPSSWPSFGPPRVGRYPQHLRGGGGRSSEKPAGAARSRPAWALGWAAGGCALQPAMQLGCA